MTKKELKNLASKIAEAELIIQNSADQKETIQAMAEIMALSGQITSFEEIDALDTLIQEKLKKKMNSLT